MPKCSAEPRPVSPRTPRAWASSTISHAPYFSLRATRLGRSPISPSMEYRPSATINARLWKRAVLLQQRLECFGIVVLEGVGGGARQPDADDQAVVRQVVVEDEVVRRHERADRGHVGGVPADEGDRCLDAVEIGQRPLEHAVHRPLAGDDAARRHRCAEAVDGLLGSVHDGGMLIEAQIVVGGEVDVALPGDLGRHATARLVAAIEGVLDIEQPPDLLVLEDAPIERQVRKAWRGLCRIVDDLLRLAGGQAAGFRRGAAGIGDGTCGLPDRASRVQSRSDHRSLQHCENRWRSRCRTGSIDRPNNIMLVPHATSRVVDLAPAPWARLAGPKSGGMLTIAMWILCLICVFTLFFCATE